MLLNILGVLSLVSLYKTHTCSPGDIPLDWDTSGVAAGFGLSQWGLCKVCDLVLPPRAQHCKALKKCVSRYDHYCPWADNAVGQNNYRFYVLLLTYGVTSVVGVVLGTSSYMFSALFNLSNVCSATATPQSSIVVTLLLFASLPIGFSLFNLWYFHMLLLKYNFTTKEFFTWKSETNASTKELRPSSYDAGSFLANAVDAFQIKNEHLLFCFLPL